MVIRDDQSRGKPKQSQRVVSKICDDSVTPGDGIGTRSVNLRDEERQDKMKLNSSYGISTTVGLLYLLAINKSKQIS
jgi:hypothetical protein